jgi:flagellar FliL protein
MAEEEKEEKKEGGEEAAPKKSKKKLIIIIAVVVILLVAGGAAFLLMGGKSDGAEEALEPDPHAEDEEEEHYERVELENIIVNLSENASFLKVKIAMEVNAEVLHGGHAASGGAEGGGGHGGGGDSGLPGVLGEREPMVRDAIIRILSSKLASEVLSVEGKEALKEELVDAINEAVATDEPLVVSVYFTDFIIQ